MPGLVSPQHQGFIIGRDTVTIVNTAFTAFDVARSKSTPLGMIFLNAEKALDRVGWDYLWATLRMLGIKGKLLQWMQALYDHPSAKLSYAGLQSITFHILWGTCQGCPLSPLLFALSMEPFLVSLQNQPQITPFVSGLNSLKITVYADDIAVYSTDVGEAMKGIIF